MAVPLVPSLPVSIESNGSNNSPFSLLAAAFELDREESTQRSQAWSWMQYTGEPRLFRART